MRPGPSARLVHRYAVRVSDRQRAALGEIADACEVSISVLLRVAIRWVIAAGPTVLDAIAPERPLPDLDADAFSRRSGGAQ